MVTMLVIGRTGMPSLSSLRNVSSRPNAGPATWVVIEMRVDDLWFAWISANRPLYGLDTALLASMKRP